MSMLPLIHEPFTERQAKAVTAGTRPQHSPESRFACKDSAENDGRVKEETHRGAARHVKANGKLMDQEV